MVLSRQRGWLPTRRGNVAILAPLTLLGEGAVLPSLKRSVVAASIPVGIALTSKLGQLSQKVAYSPARDLAPRPGGGIVIAVRAEYVVNHRTRLDVRALTYVLSVPASCHAGIATKILSDIGRKAIVFITIFIHSLTLDIRPMRKMRKATVTVTRGRHRLYHVTLTDAQIRAAGRTRLIIFRHSTCRTSSLRRTTL